MQQQEENLAEALGYDAGAKLLIITGDEFGECHAANKGVIDVMEKGLMTSATVMMPSPWAMEAVEYVLAHPEGDFGVHLTVTCRYRHYRLKPLCPPEQVGGLYAPDGCMWQSVREMWKHAAAEEVKRECRAQIEMALQLGVDVTHLDPHESIFVFNLEEFGRIYAELAQQYSLPLRVGSSQRYAGGAELRKSMKAHGCVLSDDWIGDKLPGETMKDFYIRRFRSLVCGVTDFWIHPAVESEELKAVDPDGWQDRLEDYHLFLDDPDIRSVIEQEGIILIGWKRLRELQRSQGAS